MTKPEMTKKVFAEALKKLAKKTSIDKIPTREIILTSGLSSKTFYNHFKDKQELVVWIFHTEIEEVIASITQDGDVANSSQIKDKIKKATPYDKPFYIEFSEQTTTLSGKYWKCVGKHLYDNRAFYLNAFESSCQNNLRDYLFILFRKQFKLEIIEMLGDRECCPHDIDFLAEYFTNACVGYLIHWVQHCINDYTPGSLHIDPSILTQNCMRFVLNSYILKA
ncbi:MAG: TetR/AcrR family transcriptional regulator [Desulfitobacterium sp.]